MYRLESPHASLSDPRWLVRELGSIVAVLGGVVDCIGDKFSMSNTVASKLVGDDTSRFIATRSKSAFEEALCGLSVSAVLQEHIDHFTILVNGAPKIVLFPLDSHENLIKVEGIAITRMPAPKSPSVLGTKFDTP
jgi:hypothetical protein